MTKTTKLELTREISRTEKVEAEIIGTFVPQEIESFIVIEGRDVDVFNRRVDIGKPVFWPPQRWAIEPKYDYFLVRVPRAK